MRAFEEFLPETCKNYPDFVFCCPQSACKIYLAYQIEVWNMTGSNNNTRTFQAVLEEGDYNPNDASHANRAILIVEPKSGESS